MKIAIIPTSVEPHLFQQVLNLPPEHILDLVETVGVAAILSPPLAKTQEDKIAVAFVMLANANTMLEQCGCKVDTKITNKTWTHPSAYQTNMEKM